MALQLSTSIRNARLDAIDTTAGSSVILKVFDGTLPTNCAALDDGTLLGQVALPVTWLASASAAVISKVGTWPSITASVNGVARYFRIYDSGDSVCHIQGSVSASIGDMIVNTVNWVATQQFEVTAFSIADGNP